MKRGSCAFRRAARNRHCTNSKLPPLIKYVPGRGPLIQHATATFHENNARHLEPRLIERSREPPPPEKAHIPPRNGHGRRTPPHFRAPNCQPPLASESNDLERRTATVIALTQRAPHFSNRNIPPATFKNYLKVPSQGSRSPPKSFAFLKIHPRTNY